ncbi:MAG: hypothetical protein LBT05_10905 [Planctomycetaceae bacterium]|nr:hypothetical protein [Planctomycetaceae bacterium]
MTAASGCGYCGCVPSTCEDKPSAAQDGALGGRIVWNIVVTLIHALRQD